MKPVRFASWLFLWLAAMLCLPAVVHRFGGGDDAAITLAIGVTLVIIVAAVAENE